MKKSESLPGESGGRTLQAERTAGVKNPEVECTYHIQRTARGLLTVIK